VAHKAAVAEAKMSFLTAGKSASRVA